MTGPEWRHAGLVLGAIAGLHVVGFTALLALVAPGTSLGAGVGIAAYALGMRHAFDIDHLGAIDNVTRKLMAEGQRPLFVGFFFSLGHSTVVLLLVAMVGIDIKGIANDLADPGSSLQQLTGVIGPSISGGFLVLIGLINLVAFVELARMFRAMRVGGFDEEASNDRLRNRGFMNRILRRVTDAITRPWQMYPLGFLFGLGFDTATEIALLATAGTAAVGGLPLYAILTLPILFAAGMTLADTLNGAFMNVAYGRALAAPVRTVYYNLTVTGLSVLGALLIGSIEICQVLSDRLDLDGAFWVWCQGLDFTQLGFGLVTLFVMVWALALSIWHFGRIEQTWATARGCDRRAPS